MTEDERVRLVAMLSPRIHLRELTLFERLARWVKNLFWR